MSRTPLRVIADNVLKSIDGRPPPHSLDAEVSVLGACIIDPRLIPRATSMLKREHFYSEAHGLIWEATMAVHEQGLAVDIVSVGDRLRTADKLGAAGGMAYMTDVINAVPAISNIDTYARLVYDTWRVRKALVTIQTFQSHAYLGYDDAQDLINDVRNELSVIADGGRRYEIQSNLDTLKEIVKAVRDSRDKTTHVTGIATGCDPYDRLTAGLHSKDTTMVGARPGIGKTAMMGQWAYHVAKSGIGAGIISLEMPREDLIRRMLCAEGRIDGMRLRRGTISQTEWSSMVNISQEISQLPLWIYDTNGGIHIGQVREMVFTTIEAAKRKRVPLGVMFIDFLQHLIRAPGEERMTDAQYLGIASRTLSDMAKELKIPFVVNVALNRKVEQRTGAVRFPRMSDIRDCGNIESNANNIILLHRDGKVDEDGGEKLDESGKTYMIVAKQRNGPSDKTIILKFHGAETRFSVPGGVNDHLFDN